MSNEEIPWDGLSDEDVKGILTRARVIMVIGASRDPRKPSGHVPLYLMSKGYRVVPVNPFASEIKGVRVLNRPSDYAGTEHIDVVDVFRPSHEIPSVVESIKDLSFDVLWLQEGIYHPAVLQLNEKKLVWNRCMMKEHVRLIGRPLLMRLNALASCKGRFGGLLNSRLAH
ncbi:MAG: CoA-binding protein [Thermoprotei archaeon]|nr:CoA-binding protein [TACK group archaeon]